MQSLWYEISQNSLWAFKPRRRRIIRRRRRNRRRRRRGKLYVKDYYWNRKAVILGWHAFWNVKYEIRIK